MARMQVATNVFFTIIASYFRVISWFQFFSALFLCVFDVRMISAELYFEELYGARL